MLKRGTILKHKPELMGCDWRARAIYHIEGKTNISVISEGNRRRKKILRETWKNLKRGIKNNILMYIK